MKAILIDSTNKMMTREYGNIKGTLIIGDNVVWFRSLSTSFYTSSIVDYKLIDKETVIINTLNSTYTFKLIDCEFDSSGMRDIEPSIIEEHESMKTQKFKKWSCQLGRGQLRGVRSIVTLKEAMTKNEAEEYILDNNIKDDLENEPILLLTRPVKED
jgi:hypothetical protein